MMKNIREPYDKRPNATTNLCVCIFVLLVAVFAITYNAEALNYQIKRASLSVPDITIGAKDRIVEFKVKMLYGFVASVPRIPPGWFFRVDLPLQWKTNVVAGRIIGVAALTSDETDYFKDFLIIENTGAEDEPLQIEVEITVERWQGGDKVLHFGMEKLRLKEIDDTGKP